MLREMFSAAYEKLYIEWQNICSDMTFLIGNMYQTQTNLNSMNLCTNKVCNVHLYNIPTFHMVIEYDSEIKIYDDIIPLATEVILLPNLKPN